MEARKLKFDDDEEGARRAPLPVEARPLLSIVIVTWNSGRWIDRCLRSIPAACEGVAHEVVIYDNASNDATLQLVADRGARVMRAANNDGFAAGTNRAVRETAGRYVFLLNPDCELAPHALASLVRFLDDHPKLAGAAPLFDGDEQREFQLRRLPTLRSFVSEIFAFHKLFPQNRHTAHHRYRGLDLTEPRRIEQPAAAALLLRREVFDEVGPFDEQFAPAWFEDVDYCRRLAEAGKEVWVVPAARAVHVGGASLEHVPFERFTEVWYRNMWRYARKWFSAGRAEALRWLIVGGMMLRIAAAAIGVAHPEVGRKRAMRAYAGVLRSAWTRWSAR
ncbi:MAG TPA: glycosyltransferase family 2 protein [Thermoanaerobaculia bacterium]|nr:glycosyltransferase family 2 protein [Thermoanaerobaculia bacterium]